MTERIDPDYNPSEREVENFAKLFAMLGQRVGSVRFVNGNGNGSWRDWILGITMLLAASGIGGVVLMYGDQSRLSQAVSDLKEQTKELKADVKELTNTLRSRQ